jgi:hypothetical protein
MDQPIKTNARRNNMYINIQWIFVVLVVYHAGAYAMQHNKQPHAVYDCEKLKQQYTSLQDTPNIMDDMIKALLLDHQKGNCNDQFVSPRIACLICFGADQHTKAKMPLYNTDNGSNKPVFVSPLKYATAINDTRLRSFLLNHKAQKANVLDETIETIQ